MDATATETDNLLFVPVVVEPSPDLFVAAVVGGYREVCRVYNHRYVDPDLAVYFPHQLGNLKELLLRHHITTV
jgi:hypothetical protein